ncbi:MAG TPA: hypothetical protein DCX17_03145 [Firmicutes bacterium]|nr:hypothetical protein [Bacillota bacterium]
MKYKVTKRIACPRNIVSRLFSDRECMHEWEQGLVAINDVRGHLFENDSQGELVFSFNGERQIMKVRVTNYDLPTTITLVYELGGVYNECINSFIEEKDETIWTMDVTFVFNEDATIPEDVFVKKTNAGMDAFLSFVVKNIN